MMINIMINNCHIINYSQISDTSSLLYIANVSAKYLNNIKFDLYLERFLYGNITQKLRRRTKLCNTQNNTN